MRDPALDLLYADEDLRSLVEGDAQAFAVLYDRHGRVAYSLATSGGSLAKRTA